MKDGMQDKRNAMKITRDYFDSLLIEMRHLDSQVPHTELHLFGETFQTPIMMAALSHLQQVRENGMVLMAEAAKASNAVMWCGMGPEQELEDILATGAKTIKIIKPYADRDSIYGKIQHAADCGALAVGMDIDHQYNGSGHPDLVEGMQMAPVSTQELGEFVKSSPLPFVVKGVLSVQDAVKCMQVGASAIVLSHHNGIIPYAVPPLMVLPDIAKAVKGKMKIFVDCGIETGADAFKALALGADAVSVGKPMMGCMKENGVQGMIDKIDDITNELRGIMARTSSNTLKGITADLLHMRNF